jgi:hypothetical protein
MKRAFLAVLPWAVLPFLAAPAFAQHSHGYAGHEGRDIKSLSSEEVKQYRAGAGMAFALPAELNQYPGPMHALELADKLKLTGTQRASLQALMDEHKAQARTIGTRLVDAERRLDELFASRQVSAQELGSRVRAAGDLRSEYRLSHLETHRRTRDLLSDEQVKLYDHLRGYAGTTPPK